MSFSTSAKWLSHSAVIDADVSPDGCRLAVTTVVVPLGPFDERVDLHVVDIGRRQVTALAAAFDGDHTAR
jgi:hypothetical protein